MIFAPNIGIYRVLTLVNHPSIDVIRWSFRLTNKRFIDCVGDPFYSY